MVREGKVFKYNDNVDTDVIIPARYLNTSDPRELASHCMEDIDKDFIKNVKDGDIIVADLVSYQHALRSSKDNVVVPSAHTNIVHISSILNFSTSHILRNGGSSASEHISILIQRHDHSVSHLRLLVEVRERERIQGLLKIRLLITH